MEKSALDQKIENAIDITCEAITAGMQEVIWDADRMAQRHPSRLFTFLARGATLVLAIARAHHLLAEVRLNRSTVQKEKALEKLTKANQEFEKAKAGVAKSVRV